ncbi:ATP-binding cassette domain-containing protein [Cellulosimicrobium terreum]|nr:ATP-binding cassette domain-containing protein [Cellulosimicrobium terreum]
MSGRHAREVPAHTTDASAGPGPAPSGTLVEATGVVKTYGSLTAVDDVSLRVGPGEIVGLLGANGAGKTTLLRVLLALEAADAGEVRVLGTAPAAADRHALGYVPQGLGLYTDLSVDQNVEFVAHAYSVTDPPPLPVELAAVRRTLVARIGLGLQRRLAFHCALLHAPRLLILDEPTSGVDPLARARLWDTIHEQAEAGVGVLVTTHYMQEATQCSRLEIMAHGRRVAHGTVDDITAGREAVVVRTDDWAAAFGALADAGLPVVLDGRTTRVAGRPPADVEAALARAGVEASTAVVPATLEETMVLVDRGEA